MRRLTLAVLSSACLASCTATPSNITAVDPLRLQTASQLFENNQLAQSLQQWQILALRHPDNANIQTNVKRVKKEIEQQTVALLDKVSALDKNDRSQEKMLLLRVLAINPSHADAKAWLRQMSYQRELANADSKTLTIARKITKKAIQSKKQRDTDMLLAQANDALINNQFYPLLALVDKLELVSPEHAQIKRFRYAALLGQAKVYMAQKTSKNAPQKALAALIKAQQFVPDGQASDLQKDINALKTTQSNHYMIAAQKVLSKDIHEAVVLLEKAVAINENNVKAAQQLAQAKKIQQNLLRINALN